MPTVNVDHLAQATGLRQRRTNSDGSVFGEKWTPLDRHTANRETAEALIIPGRARKHTEQVQL